MPDTQISYCKSELMSICTACSKEQQKRCLYYQKASVADRCMYRVFNEYCDCVEAQKQAQKN